MAYAGNYFIRSVLSNETYLSIPAISNRLFAPVVGRVPGEAYDPTGPARWRIVDEGSETYSIQYNGGGSITIDGDGLRVYFLSDVQSSKFSIEAVGGNEVRFHVPNADSVWTLNDDGTGNPVFGTPVTLEPEHGLASQHWSLESLD